ncbi:outer membrane beta-barrel protein [Congregibacter litoralis]|uniref:Outer membrane protein beta-barrel domain protein n=1 Tax=Congregibacter litoralis KT71 TaxID=314285 RepID=A4A4Z9_9GAMM|nr:outer membrane beta-barrel protein [Congregibacter litoralis]EAQ98870.2 Outer membrane protein beta-barrel domain protein [Congregibacter litoralis KT71]
MQLMRRYIGAARPGVGGALCAALTILLSASALAEDASQSEVHGSVHESSSHHGGLGFPHHTLGVFFGDTTETRRNQGFTLGLEYEYRVNEQFGVGAILEHVGGDFHTNVAVVPLAYHRGPWKLYAGPGIEDSEEEGSAFLLRVGLEYGFHVGKYELSPQIDVDFVDNEHLFIFGVTVARPF